MKSLFLLGFPLVMAAEGGNCGPSGCSGQNPSAVGGPREETGCKVASIDLEIGGVETWLPTSLCDPYGDWPADTSSFSFLAQPSYLTFGFTEKDGKKQLWLKADNTAPSAGMRTEIEFAFPGSGVDLPNGVLFTTFIAVDPTRKTVNVAPDEGGRVVSTPPGINCGSDCSERFAVSTTVMLTVEPMPNYQFMGWTGDCARFGTQPSVSLTVTDNLSCAVQLQELGSLNVTLVAQQIGTVPHGEMYEGKPIYTLTANINPYNSAHEYEYVFNSTPPEAAYEYSAQQGGVYTVVLLHSATFTVAVADKTTSEGGDAEAFVQYTEPTQNDFEFMVDFMGGVYPSGPGLITFDALGFNTTTLMYEPIDQWRAGVLDVPVENAIDTYEWFILDDANGPVDVNATPCASVPGQCFSFSGANAYGHAQFVEQFNTGRYTVILRVRDQAGLESTSLPLRFSL